MNLSKAMLQAAFTAALCFAAAGRGLCKDTEQWSVIAFSRKIDDRWSVFFKPHSRIRDDVSQLYYWELRAGATCKVSDHWSLTGSYLFSDIESQSNVNTEEHRITLAPAFSARIGDLVVSDRNRMEYRKLGGRESWRYRNMIKLTYPVELWGETLRPYVSNEVFYDFDAEKYNQNRASVGVAKQVTDDVQVSLYYMRKAFKTGQDWSSVNIIGTSLSVKL